MNYKRTTAQQQGDNVARSIWSLAKNNNGYFKSQKQADFLIGYLSADDGLFSFATVYGNQCRVCADWDAQGITRIYNQSVKTGETTKWERVDGQTFQAGQERKARFQDLKAKHDALEAEIAQAWEDEKEAALAFARGEQSIDDFLAIKAKREGLEADRLAVYDEMTSL